MSALSPTSLSEDMDEGADIEVAIFAIGMDQPCEMEQMLRRRAWCNEVHAMKNV